MDFFEQPGFRLNKRLLSIIGVWPFQRPLAKLLRQGITLIPIFVLLAAEVILEKEKLHIRTYIYTECPLTVAGYDRGFVLEKIKLENLVCTE